MDPADFYTGLVADLYDPLKAHSFDAEPYRAFIEQWGEPALELGCGDGEPLLDLRAQGLDVDGVDSSRDMLDRCAQQARARGISVTLHKQRMEDLDLPRRYRSIFLAGPTITLLLDDTTAGRALTAIARHLDKGGRALVPVTEPAPTPLEAIGKIREVAAQDGSTLRVTVLRAERDETARTQTTTLRYEREHTAGNEQLDREWTLHWYPRDVLTQLITKAGLTIEKATRSDGTDATDDDTDVHLTLRHS